jgi:ribosomal protein S18 acetylase RimI-like enzyme
MCVATEGDAVRGVAVYRISENTFEGLHLYVDDLVTDEKLRSRGIGHALMEHLQSLAQAARCEATTLDSGTQRTQAHKFYFREGMTITSFHFTQVLSDRPLGLKR